jgi:phospholipase C
MNMNSLSRADVLKLGLGTAASIGLSANTADARSSSSLNDIDHFVILMKENRSFDHYFGTLSGVRGFGGHTAQTPSDWPQRLSSAGHAESGWIRSSLSSGYRNDQRDAVARS